MMRSRHQELDKMIQGGRNPNMMNTGEANSFIQNNGVGRQSSKDALNKSQVVPKNVMQKKPPKRSLERELLEKRISQVEEPNSEDSSSSQTSESRPKLPDDTKLMSPE